jgi:hypothetical protein
MVKPKSFKEQSLGLSYVPTEVALVTTSGTNTQTMVATFKDYYGNTLTERVHVGLYFTTAYSSYAPVIASVLSAGVTLENPLRPGTNPLAYSSMATTGYVFDCVTCGDGTATYIVSSATSISLYPKFLCGGRVLEDYTAALTL